MFHWINESNGVWVSQGFTTTQECFEALKAELLNKYAAVEISEENQGSVLRSLMELRAKGFQYDIWKLDDPSASAAVHVLKRKWGSLSEHEKMQLLDELSELR